MPTCRAEARPTAASFCHIKAKTIRFSIHDRQQGVFWDPWHRGGVRAWFMGIGLGAALVFETAGMASVAAGAGLLLLSMVAQF